MSKCCDDECKPICDFCRYYNFNPGIGGVYTGDGYCVFHEIIKEPCDFCDDYICEWYKKKSRHSTSKEIIFINEKKEL